MYTLSLLLRQMVKPCASIFLWVSQYFLKKRWVEQEFLTYGNIENLNIYSQRVDILVFMAYALVVFQLQYAHTHTMKIDKTQRCNNSYSLEIELSIKYSTKNMILKLSVNVPNLHVYVCIFAFDGAHICRIRGRWDETTRHVHNPWKQNLLRFYEFYSKNGMNINSSFSKLLVSFLTVWSNYERGRFILTFD